MTQIDSKIQWLRAGSKEEICLLDGEEARLVLIVLDCDKTETDLTVRLKGRGAAVDTQVLFLGGGQERFSIQIRHVHEAPQTRSALHARGAVTSSAEARFWGTIDMQAHCQDAQGILNEHMLLLSPLARIETVPALEIAHHQVAASHSASIERVDREKLFYLMSRGLPEAMAFQLIVEGFFAEILKALPDSDSIFEKFLAKLNQNMNSSASNNL